MSFAIVPSYLQELTSSILSILDIYWWKSGCKLEVDLPMDILGAIFEELAPTSNRFYDIEVLSSLRTCLFVSHNFRHLALTRLGRIIRIRSNDKPPKLERLLRTLVSEPSSPANWEGIKPYIKEIELSLTQRHSKLIDFGENLGYDLLTKVLDGVYHGKNDAYGATRMVFDAGDVTIFHLPRALQPSILRLLKAPSLVALEIRNCRIHPSFLSGQSIQHLTLLHVSPYEAVDFTFWTSWQPDLGTVQLCPKLISLTTDLNYSFEADVDIAVFPIRKLQHLTLKIDSTQTMRRLADSAMNNWSSIRFLYLILEVAGIGKKTFGNQNPSVIYQDSVQKINFGDLLQLEHLTIFFKNYDHSGDSTSHSEPPFDVFAILESIRTPLQHLTDLTIKISMTGPGDEDASQALTLFQKPHWRSLDERLITEHLCPSLRSITLSLHLLLYFHGTRHLQVNDRPKFDETAFSVLARDLLVGDIFHSLASVDNINLRTNFTSELWHPSFID